MSVEQYWAPASLADALEHLRGGNVTILAGGTDLMPQSHAGRVTLQRGLLNIRRVPELHRIERDGAGVRIGALCTMTELHARSAGARALRHPRRGLRPFRQRPVAQRRDDRRQCLQCVARRRPAGRRCSCSTREAELASKPNGSVAARRMPLAEFFVGPGKTKRAPDELLLRGLAAAAAAGLCRTLLQVRHAARARHLDDLDRHRRRAATASALTRRAGRLRRGRADADARAADRGGARGLRARRRRRSRGSPASPRDEVRPIDDVRASAWYRRELVRNMTRRMLDHVAQA